MKTTAVLDRAMESLGRRVQGDGGAADAVVEMATLVANADGKIDQAELAAIRHLLSRTIKRGLLGESLDDLIRDSVEASEAVGGLSRARTTGATLASFGAGEDGVRCALAIAYSSDGLSADERAVIEQLAFGAAIAYERLEALIAEIGVACELAS
jgi:tellurite resistance protein